MKTIINNQNCYERNDYYFGMMEDMRNIFIDYGKNLEKNNISGYGTIEDYENFLMFREAQEKEFDLDVYESNLPQKTEDYLEFLSFLLEQEDWDNELVIIKGEEWDEFYSSDDEDREMKMVIIQASEFYDKFAEITNTNQLKFESYFVSSKYIDTYTYNTMNLIVKINGVNQRFIVDAV